LRFQFEEYPAGKYSGKIIKTYPYEFVIAYCYFTG